MTSVIQSVTNATTHLHEYGQLVFANRAGLIEQGVNVDAVHAAILHTVAIHCWK